MIHLGARAFKEISGEVVQTITFTIREKNLKIINEYILGLHILEVQKIKKMYL